MAVLNFNAATVEPQKPLETVPAGWYTVQMVASDAQPTKNGKGSYLETEYEIMYPVEYKGRKLFDRFNLQNDNPQAVEIAYRALSAVCHAVGVIQVQDSQQLHGKPLQAKVKLVPAGAGNDGKHYEAKNEISGYKAVEGGAFTGSSSASAAAPAWATGNPLPATPAGGVTPPWAGQPAQAPAPSAPATPPWASQQPTAPAQPPAPPSVPTPPWAAQPAQQPAPQAPVQGGAPTPPWAAAPAPQAPTGGAPTPPWAGGAPAQGGAPVPPWAQR